MPDMGKKFEKSTFTDMDIEFLVYIKGFNPITLSLYYLFKELDS